LETGPLGLGGVVQLVNSSRLGYVTVVESGAYPDDRRTDYRRPFSGLSIATRVRDVEGAQQSG
jgi:hypothetical protein